MAPATRRADGGGIPQVVWRPGGTIILPRSLYTAEVASGEGDLSLPHSTCPIPPRASIQCLRDLLGGQGHVLILRPLCPLSGGKPVEGRFQGTGCKECWLGKIPRAGPHLIKPHSPHASSHPPPTHIPGPRIGAIHAGWHLQHTHVSEQQLACLPTFIHPAGGSSARCQSGGVGALAWPPAPREPWVSRDRREPHLTVRSQRMSSPRVHPQPWAQVRALVTCACPSTRLWPRRPVAATHLS